MHRSNFTWSEKVIYVFLSICNMFIHVCMNKDIKVVNLIEIKECAWEGLKEKR